MSRRSDFIIPECYVDTNLVETLVCKDGCNHQKGCNQVAKIMQEKFVDRFAVGIIDADKRRPSYINEFEEIASSIHLKVLRHNNRPHFIVLVSPAADGFILDCAEGSGTNLSVFGLSSALKDFTMQTKNVMTNRDIRFKQLFRAMQDYGEIRLLKTIISYFVENTYKSSDKGIADIFLSFLSTH